MTKNIRWGSVVAGVGLLGLAVYQVTVSDLPAADRAALAALAAFGVLANNTAHEELKLKLARRGMVRDD